MDAQQQELVAQFVAVTGSDAGPAQTALASANWNLEEAVSLYYAENDDPRDQDMANDSDEDDPVAALPPQATQAQPSASSSSGPSRNPPGQRPKQMTLDDLKKREENSDEGEDDGKKTDMFAGGEKSALAVQNPGESGKPVDHFKNIMNQARQNRDRPAGPSEEAVDRPPQSSNFFGRAQTLGGDEAESQVIEDPAAPAATRPGQQASSRVNRTLHLWADGVSIDDGPLFRFDDPANQGIMAEINRGRAPLALLNVQPDQEVDLNLEPHDGENYVQPKKQYKPFGSSGQRLGSPVPSASTSTTTTTTATTSQPPSSSTQAADTTQVQVDESAPTLQLQIRLGDGTRLASRFNTTHTIGDVYAFVDASSPASTQRSYALITTFPNKELDDRGLVLGDMGELKRGGVVVQKWK